MGLSGLNKFLDENIRDRKILIILSDSMIKRFDLYKTMEMLKQKNEVIHISKVPANPTEIDVKNLLKQINGTFQTVLAIGGGSAIDLAKAAVALAYLQKGCNSIRNVKSAIIHKEYLEYKNSVEFIAVPTTAGTGSEVTRWATIWDSDKQNKMSIDAPWLAPAIALIVPELTLQLSARQTLATGLDALTHGVESYWAKKSNPISRELSKIAINMIVTYLPKVMHEPDNLKHRNKMSMAALYAGLAFANTRTTACHSISYPLTMNYRVEHGFAAAVTLISLMKFNSDCIIEPNELLRAFKADSINQIQKWLDDVSREIQLLRLSAFGIKKTEIEKIANNAFAMGRMDNNPAECTVADVVKILGDIY